ncbi:polyhydroxyalkanoic acid system family protein [Altererythrobacter fulvus]|uniref:polyhydroxyalkanoic acid system family protein n=1 Tax=Caenibius fulvus TaxID=2126012 RepID=UPI0030164C63
MRIVLPHSLGKEEVRRRLHDNSHKIASHLPGGMAEVTTDWAGEDRMTMAIAAMGQTLSGAVEIGEGEVAFELELPLALSFAKPMAEAAMRQMGEKLLAAPRD